MRQQCTITTDAHDTIFLWHGKSSPLTLRSHPNPLERLTRSSYRFPFATRHTLTEGESMQQRFVTRLTPSHGDYRYGDRSYRQWKDYAVATFSSPHLPKLPSRNNQPER